MSNDLLAKLESLKQKQAKAKASLSEQAKEQAERVKAEIAPEGKIPPEQGNLLQWCGYPTDMTRCSPFFPLAQHRMKERKYLEDFIITSAGWGEILYTGPQLSIQDEDVLIGILAILESSIQRTEIELEDGRRTYTYRGPARPFLNLLSSNQPGKREYARLVSSLRRLHGAVFELRTTRKTKQGKKGSRKSSQISNILTHAYFDEDSGDLIVTVNPFFYEMYLAGTITLLDVAVRAKLKGSVSKALYRFVQSHRTGEWKGHFLTLAQALNLDLAQPEKQIRRIIKTAMTELRRVDAIDAKRSRFLNPDLVQLIRTKKALPRRKKEVGG